MSCTGFDIFGDDSCDNNSCDALCLNETVSGGGYSVQNIEITADVELPDPASTPYSKLQFKKSSGTSQDIVISFRGKQMAKLYSNFEQTVIFNKFNDTWI